MRTADLTPYQHHYPHFLDIARWNADLRDFHLQAVIQRDSSPEDEHLAIKRRDPSTGDLCSKPVLVFYPGTFLMVQGKMLYAWQKFTDGILIHQYAIDEADIAGSMHDDFIEILKTKPGVHQRKTPLIYNHLVTYIRKQNLDTIEDWYEKYVILHLHEDRIQVVPMDILNETGGDPMYVWPALASFSPSKGILYGHGMRMGTFEVKMPSME